MTMLTKTLTVEVKAIGDDDSGLFQAYASVFNNVDSYGDMVIPGAFLESLREYGSKGQGIPLYWRHRMDDPFMNLGATTEAREDNHGLWTESQLDLTNETAQQVYKLLKEGRVRQMSFAYDILEAAWVERKPEDGGSYYELRKLRIHEISIVPVGANQETEILAVKSARDAVVAALTDARPKADESASTPDESIAVKNQGTADEPSDAKTEEPSGAKAEEPTTGPSAQHLGLINIYASL
ncbi:HK97 family phage prohead protease [Microbacterium maritypicum]|uniref:HK97 family phage prohead protease n=1 Tax=Microbacterium maritypicum TaxID=33918 RepID=UPI003D7221EB